MKGNLAIVNANVIPMADDKRFSAILVENGDIRALGTDSEIRALAGGRGSRFGTGGMVTKLNAAELAAQYGFPTMILNGQKPETLYECYDGASVGTLFDIRGGVLPLS